LRGVGWGGNEFDSRRTGTQGRQAGWFSLFAVFFPLRQAERRDAKAWDREWVGGGLQGRHGAAAAEGRIKDVNRKTEPEVWCGGAGDDDEGRGGSAFCTRLGLGLGGPWTSYPRFFFLAASFVLFFFFFIFPFPSTFLDDDDEDDRFFAFCEGGADG